jgi:hypothetical protein
LILNEIHRRKIRTGVELLENEGYPHQFGNTIQRNDDEVLIEEDILNYLLKRYEKHLAGQDLQS